MIDTGLENCGANVPFADKEIFFGSVSRIQIKSELSAILFQIAVWQGAFLFLWT
jgi:hypothetical protein